LNSIEELDRSPLAGGAGVQACRPASSLTLDRSLDTLRLLAARRARRHGSLAGWIAEPGEGDKW
jgi:hypothetical protein